MTDRSIARLFAGAAAAVAVAWAGVAQAQQCNYPLIYRGQTGTCTMAQPWLVPLDPALQPKFAVELPQPVFYTPTKDGAFDYYEIESRVANTSLANPDSAGSAPFGFTNIVSPNFTERDFIYSTTTDPIVAQKNWLGLRCPAGGFAGVGARPCTPNAPLYTEVWGYGQVNGGDTDGLFTYPAMSFKATPGTPVKVLWKNGLPDQHLFCKRPTDARFPCAIDRTLMGTLVYPNESVGPFGGPQQPDNAMVVHLHGGEIPPDSDGFAELWFGNANSKNAYPPSAFPEVPVPGSTFGATQNIDPILDTTLAGPNGVQLGSLIRPTGDSMLYNYPMVQDAATIWYHDHALGKTRINVAAGPAGYFYVEDQGLEASLGLRPGGTYAFGNCSNTGILTGKCYDVPIVLQDRAFNADGSINFPNGLGQIAPAGVVGWNPLYPGPNPLTHPQWVPEYFGDVAVVNGVIWPKMTVEPRQYRIRFLDGSNARCWTLGLKSQRGTNLAFTVIASDQGFLRSPASLGSFSICPGERFEAVVDFTNYAGQTITLSNTANAPFPNGISVTARNSPFRFLANVMQFRVLPAVPATSPAVTRFVAPMDWATTMGPKIDTRAGNGLPACTPTTTTGCRAPDRVMILNEVLDPFTLAPLRVQIDGKRFEDPVTETPKRGTAEVWHIINTTVDAHPMHLHLVGFKVLSRQKIDIKRIAALPGFPNLAVPLTVAQMQSYLIGSPMAPRPEESGLKDTVKTFPGEVTTIIAKWDGGWPDSAATANGGPYFQPVTSGPYVWHCHIVDHEDNEMMRPTLVLP